MLPSALLAKYAHDFYGVGNWEARVWFIGVEEAGGRSGEEVLRRLHAWSARGRRDLEDAPSFYPGCGNHSWHGQGAVLQPTWKQLIRMLLLARGEDDAEARLLDYQQSRLGSAFGETCLVELLPLPSPDTATWNYGSWTDLPWLKDRQAYMDKVRQHRASQLREKIAEYRPPVVIFYGTSLNGRPALLQTWSSIAGGRFEQALPTDRILLWREHQGTAFFVTNHPAAPGLRPNADEHFSRIGRFLRGARGAAFHRD